MSGGLPSAAPIRSVHGVRRSTLWALAIRNLGRRHQRSLAIAGPLTLAVGLLYASMLVADGVRADARLAASTLPDLLIQRAPRGALEPIEVAPVRRALEVLPEVEAVRGRVWTLAPAPGEDDGGALAIVVGDAAADVEEARAWRPTLTASEERLPPPVAPGEVLLGPGLVQLGGARAQIGGSWEVRGRAESRVLRVVGHIDPDAAILAANLALAHPDDVRALEGLDPGWATEVAVYLQGGDAARATAEIAVRTVAGARLIERAAAARLADVVYGDRLGRWAALWLLLLVAPVGLAWAVGFDVAAHQRREMGVLKAMGWPAAALIELRVAESALIGALSAALGMPLALGYVALGAPGLASFFVGWAELYPSFPLPISLRLDSALAVLAVAVVPISAAAAVPAWRIGVGSADAAMRE